MFIIGSVSACKQANKSAGNQANKNKISDFHTEVLKDGSLPLSVFETKMDAWAAALK